MKYLRNIVPHFFSKEPILKITDPDFQQAIQEVRQQQTVLQAMEHALDILAQKFNSYYFESVFRLNKLCESDPNSLWKRDRFMHCTQQNYLLRILLIKSGKVKDENIQLGYSLVWCVSPHQYLIVEHKGKEIALDPWNYSRGAEINTYASGFGMRSINDQ